jgi:hypothetical protein
MLALAILGFLCFIPIARALNCLKMSLFCLVLGLLGLECGVDLKAFVVYHFPSVLMRVRVVGP